MKLRESGLGKNNAYTKRLNRQTVLDLLRRDPAQSRAELARVTRLSPQSVSNIMGDLEQAGLIEPAGKVYGGKGQPPTNYRIVAERGYGIGLHLDRDFIRAVLIDFAFEPKARLRGTLTTSSVKNVQATLSRTIDKLIAKAGISPDLVWGIGIASPRLRDERVLDTAGLEGTLWSALHSYEIDRRLAEEKRLAVIVENDANAGALAEATFGKAQGLRDFCYLFLAHGFGAGIVHDGALFQANAGEIGRLQIVHDGRTVLLEEIVSIEHLLDRLGASGGARDREAGFAGLIEARRKETEEWIALSAPHLRWLVGTLENILDPETIILASDLPEWVLDRLIERAEPLPHTIGLRSHRTEPRLQKGLLDRDMIGLGAAAMPLLATMEADPAARWKISGEVFDVFHGLDD